MRIFWISNETLLQSKRINTLSKIELLPTLSLLCFKMSQHPLGLFTHTHNWMIQVNHYTQQYDKMMFSLVLEDLLMLHCVARCVKSYELVRCIWVALNSFQPSVAFHIETSQLFYRAKQMTSFYVGRNTVLKWVGTCCYTSLFFYLSLISIHGDFNVSVSIRSAPTGVIKLHYSSVLMVDYT